MTTNERQVHCSFVMVKLKLLGSPFVLGQLDSDWKDVNLVGGHEELKDAGKPERTARRETLEELSALRQVSYFRIIPLVGPVEVGPKWSKSAKCDTRYIVHFYLLEFTEQPDILVDILARGRGNVLVPIESEGLRLSEMFEVLRRSYPGGITKIPFSWPDDLGEILQEHKVRIPGLSQRDLPLG